MSQNNLLNLVKLIIILIGFLKLVRCENYTDKYDNVNLDEILQSDRLLENYFKCLKGAGPCTPEGSELKKVLPDAVQTKCSKCTEAQKKGAKKVVEFLMDKKPELWKELLDIFDHEHKFRDMYRDDVKKEFGIDV